MNGALNSFRQKAVALLNEHGIRAVAAMESTPRKQWDGPVAAVSLRRMVCAPGGFQDYLGIHTDPGTRKSGELYGKAVEFTLSLDVYAPRNTGESTCQAAAEGMAEVLACQGLGGIPVVEIRAGAVEFLSQDGLYRLPVECTCKGWLTAAADDSGSFVDFEVKGSRL